MTYYGRNNQTYQLEDIPIKKGGEGAIHPIKGSSNLLAKIYLAPAKSPELKEKISLMVKNPPRQDILDQIAWPIDVLFDAGKNFVGFVMPKLSIDVELGEVYKYPAKKKIALTNEQKVVIAINICRVISAIHDLDYVFGDFNPCNIGVNLKTGHVAFLDTDSYHITDKSLGKTYRCNVCLNGYVAPELIKRCKNTGYAQAPLPTFTKETDLFALGIHIFKLLMNGFTPYNGIPENERSSTASPGVGNAAIEMDNYCFKAGNKPLSPAVLPLKAFPDDLQRLFTRTFDEGHKDPSKRPTAKEWDAVLTKYHSNLQNCANDPMHFYYKGLQTCPYCEADQRYNFAMSMSSVYGTSSGSSSGQMTFSAPMAVPTSTSSNRTSSNYSGRGNYSGTVISGSGSTGRVSTRNKNGFSSKFAKTLVIISIVVALIAGGAFGITTVVNNKKVEAVESAIAVIPNNSEYYLDYQAEIVDAYAAYTELDDGLKKKVNNVDKLMTAMEGLQVAEAYEQRQSMQFTKLESGGYSVKLKENAFSSISGELVVPGMYRQQPVVAIEDYAFENCRGVTSVVVPDSITTIGVGAFKGCTSIREMTLPFTGRSASATTWQAVFGYIFGYETKTQSTSNSNTTSFQNYIAGKVDNAVWQYTLIDGPYKSYFYYIPASIKSITITNQNELKDGAFNGCQNVEKVVYLESISSFGKAAFQNCQALKTFNSIEEYTCNLEGFFAELGDYAFSNCRLFKKILFTENVQIVGASAFEGCQAVSELNFTSSIQSIGNYAFSGLRLVTSVLIHDSTRLIGVGAFKGCTSIREMTLPFTGRSADASTWQAVFGYIFGYETKTQSTSNSNTTSFQNYIAGNVDNAVWQYTLIDGPYKSYFYYIPASIKSITITNQSEIQDAAFNGCRNIERITYNQTVNYIGVASFQNCQALNYLNSSSTGTADLVGQATSIGNYCLRNCENIVNVKLYTGLNLIGKYAFENISIREIAIPDTVNTIDIGALKGCTKLSKITIPFVGRTEGANTYEAVLGYIFGYETKTQSTSKSNTTSFQNYTAGNVDNAVWQYTLIDGPYKSYFYYIPSSLTEVIVTKQAKVPTAAFNGCTMLQRITFKKGISSQGDCAFQNCDATIIK